MNVPLAAALAASERGWHVFPLLPNTKQPAVKDWEKRATTNTGRIERCWSTRQYGVGIACGPSGLVVIDLDKPKPGQETPEAWRQPGITCGADVLASLADKAAQPYPCTTHTVWTGRAGEHLYFTAPDGTKLRNTQARLGWLVDTRAHGGYVVGAGSLIAGRPYTTVHDAQALPLPQWLLKALTPAPPPRQQELPVRLPTSRRTGYLAAAIRAETQRVGTAAEGQRNHVLYTAAVALGQLVAGGSLTETEVRSVLTDAAEAQVAAGAYTAWEADKTISSGLRAGAKRPRRVAA
ncbi:bifunctional DNA primase/polymerase [Kribbella solani]|uniref:bifunctional DNA primase/polymerase n=1 Tax=Kribbella solani TaxID=236067 RepID=UPI0029A71431|nr:bifunctional DNA primase/polymerase [Kribbella solani]MDX2974269.1 bifunctional DNA primase/polymerase [Kribbella solani]